MLLTSACGGRELIERACEAAAAAGIHPGMDLAQARSLIPAGTALHVRPHRPDREAEALHRLACWALRISPAVAHLPPDLIVCDLTGTGRLYGHEARVARSALRALNRLGLCARAAVASTIGCAAAVARFGHQPFAVVRHGDERGAIAPLPALALCHGPGASAMLDAFSELGIERIEQVLALPRRQLVSRFGPALLHRIDQALGHAVETIDPVRPPPPIEAEVLFDGPTDRPESVHAAAHNALETLAARLLQRSRALRRMDITILRPRPARPERLAVELSRPSVSVKHLWTMLRSRLERLDLGQQVEGLRLTASRTSPLRAVQAVDERLAHAQRERTVSAAAGELTDLLVNRLGPDRVLRFSTRPSHLPEQTAVARSVMEPCDHHDPQIAPGERPTLLLDPPEPVDALALTPDGPVLEIGRRGTRERIAACLGPERIGPEWWRWRAAPDAPARGERATTPSPPPPPPDRDYFAVQTASGRWLWVCRQVGTSRWFIHGEWV